MERGINCQRTEGCLDMRFVFFFLLGGDSRVGRNGNEDQMRMVL